MNDMLGEPLKLGDYVLVMRKGCRAIVLSRIIKFTPKGIRVVYSSFSKKAEEYVTDQAIKVLEPKLSNFPEKEDLDQLFKPYLIKMNQIEIKAALKNID